MYVFVCGQCVYVCTHDGVALSCISTVYNGMIGCIALYSMSQVFCNIYKSLSSYVCMTVVPQTVTHQ